MPRGVRLTDEGRCLLEHAEAVLGRLDTARRDLAALRDLESGRLRIGAFATADVALVPRAMAAFHTEHWIAGWAAPEDTLLGTAIPAGFEPEIRYVVPGWTAKLGLVAAGLGVTLVPGLAATPPRAAKPPAVQRFLEILARTVRELRAELSRVAFVQSAMPTKD